MLSLRLCRTALTALLTTSFAATFIATGLASPQAASAAAPPPTLFTASNAGVQTWTVPAGLTLITLNVAGGSGSDGSTGSTGAAGGAGGLGGSVVETLDVTPGDVVQILPGGSGDHPTYGDPAVAGGTSLYYQNAGGQGGGGTTVRINGNLVAIAGGGGGGGGGSRLAGMGWIGGPGGAGGGFWGTAGDGYVAGESGHGPQAGTSVGALGGAEATYSPAGAGGGGGGGYNFSSGLGGGNSGFGGNFPGGGGGGGAGGSSWGASASTQYGVAAVYGDGFVSIQVRPHHFIVASANPAPSGAPATMSDTLSSIIPGGPVPTGTVTWSLFDVYTGATSNATTVPVVNGLSSWTLPAGLALGTAYVMATYNGDNNYMPFTSGGYAEGIVADQHAWTLQPDTSPNFGMVAVGNYPTRTFTVTNYGNTTETPDVSTSDTHFQVTKNGCAPVAPGASCSLEVTFTAGSRGNFSAALYVASLGSTTIKVNLTAASDTPDFLHSVFSVAFGTVSVGQTRKIGVEIVNGNVPQTVNASIDGKKFSVAREGCDNIVAGGRCTLWVYYTPTSAGVDDTTLTITSSYGTTFTLPVTASGIVPATPSVSVTAASFGSTVLGLRSTTAVTVTNTSTVPTQVSSATFDSPTMTVASLGTCVVAIQAGGRCSFTATFAPTVAGSVAAHVKVAIPTGQAATAAATGTGVKALPTVTGITPTTGKPAGGTAVTITGTNLRPSTSVKFGTTSVAATCTATKCTAVSPAGAGTVNVRVVTPSGTSAAVTADRFTYR